MDELEISGKRYISTRRAAREHGYHSDYMGQLIRGGKVAGQKVGRAWYIDEVSLAAYFGGEQKPAEPAEKKETPTEALIEVAAPAPAPEPVVEEVPAKEDPAPPAVEMPKMEPIVAPQDLKTPEAPEEKSIRVPIRAPLMPEAGGLRYMADDSPSIPIVTRMPQAHAPVHTVAPASVAHAAHLAPRQKFPIVSLSAVALLAIAAATFASTFVSATIVSEPGKSAVVQYAIHW
ncbi:MAG TPA: hypothetical protein VJJ20_01240 [Candidatus Paceibacterota bacterium]